MRLFEILILTAAALSILNLIFIKNSALRLVIPVIASLAAIISIVYEGYRLPMLPAYLLCFILLVHGIMRALIPNIKISKPLKIAGLIFLSLIFALSITLAVFLPVSNLPKPTGSYPVGTTLLSFTDYTRKGVITIENEYRKIPVQVWYPASDIKGKKRATWLSSKKMSEAFAENKHVPNLFDQLNLIKTNSFFNAPLSSKEEKYPVLLFSGGGAMFNGQNVIQMEELASHGYIVFAVGHPYDDFACTYPDGSIIRYSEEQSASLSEDVSKAITLAKKEFAEDESNPDFLRFIIRNSTGNAADIKIWSDDMSFVADRLTELNNSSTNNIFNGKLDLASMGIFGHSFGGAAAGETCLNDKRFKAFINMDGTPFGTVTDNIIQQPFMILTSGKDKQNRISNGYSKNQKNFTTVHIQGAEHMNFSDFNTIFPVLGKTVGMLGSINVERQEQIMNDYILSFFNKHLKNREESLLDSTTSKYQEVTVEMK